MLGMSVHGQEDIVHADHTVQRLQHGEVIESLNRSHPAESDASLCPLYIQYGIAHIASVLTLYKSTIATAEPSANSTLTPTATTAVQRSCCQTRFGGNRPYETY